MLTCQVSISSADPVYKFSYAISLYVLCWNQFKASKEYDTIDFVKEVLLYLIVLFLLNIQ